MAVPNKLTSGLADGLWVVGLAYKQMLRMLAAGELRVMLAALVLAVTATTAVGFFTDRIQASLQSQGNVLLGGDLALLSDHALLPDYRQHALALGLQATHTTEFPSMVLRGEASQLAQIKAVSAPFPLRGDLLISAQWHGAGQVAASVPQVGTVWLDPRLASQLNAQVGSQIALGEAEFKVAAILQKETSRGGDMFNFAPRLMMNAQDLAATQLIQFGSRIQYQLLVAGDVAAVAEYKTWLQASMQRGQRLQDVASARPEMKSALEKAQQFLGLASMVSVVLALVAMFLASLPYVQKSLDAYALMRCFGASQALITRILLIQTLLIAVLGSVLGCLLGYGLQLGLSRLAAQLFVQDLPVATWQPLWLGMLSGLAATVSVLWPHLLQMREVPALRILRREAAPLQPITLWRYLPIVVFLAAMMLWHAGHIKIALLGIAGLLALLLLVGLIAWGVNRSLLSLPRQYTQIWRIGLAGLKRRPVMAAAQVTGISLGLMAILLLSLVRGDLLHNWQSTLPVDAPNRFVINIQKQQLAAFKDFLAVSHTQNVDVFPMVKGRLLAINQKPMDTHQYQDERARRLAEREFNLSWAQDLPKDNQILQGQWWQKNASGQPQISLEKGLAEALHLKLGDVLSYDIGGSHVDLKVTSIRKVEWDRMRANFFAMTPPQVLDNYAGSYIASFYLPVGQEESLNGLLKQFSNLTVIDVAAILQQVRGIIEKMSYALQYVFAFSLLAGMAVLYAALLATRDERIQEATLLRVLGASRWQVSIAMLSEFFAIAFIAAFIASLIANVLAYFVSVQVLDIPYGFNLGLNFAVFISALICVPLFAWLGMRSMLNRPPHTLLNAAAT